MKLRKVLLGFFCYLPLAYASAGQPVLDQIVYQVSAEQWVKTSSAEVIIAINATAKQQGLAAVRQQMMTRLNRIAKADWHITSFNRSQDSSGLERITVQAEARLPENQLANLRSAAQAVSQPGANYQVSRINFKPTLAEVEQARASVRNTLYQQINTEIKRVDEALAGHYQMHSISFIPGYQAAPLKSKTALLATKRVPSASPSLAVSDKVTLTATVILRAKLPVAKITAK